MHGIEISHYESLIFAALLSFAFVASLYIWPGSVRENRDDPQVVKRRLVSVICVALCAPFVFLLYRDPSDNSGLHFKLFSASSAGLSILAIIGFTTKSLLSALVK